MIPIIPTNFYSFTSLSSPLFFKRSMMSSATQLVKRLLHPSSHSFKPPLDNVRYYAAYSVNKPNPLNTKLLWMTILTNMNKKILYIINIFFAITFICYLFYIRILVIRLPKNLYIYENTLIKYNIILLIIAGIVISLYFIIKSIFYKTKSLNIFSKLLNKIVIFIQNTLQELHDFILSYIPNNYEKMSYLAQKFYTLFGAKSESLFSFIIFTIRLIILIAFLIDVFIYFELNYMYKMLYLLCIPLLIKAWFYSLNAFALNLDDIKAALIITDLGVDEETQLPITEYNLKEEFKHLDLEYQVQAFILCSKLSGYLENYHRYSIFLTPYFNCFIYVLYFIGWVFVLYKNVLCFY